MHILSSEKLTRQLELDIVPQTEVFGYFLFYIILTTVWMEIIYYFHNPDPLEINKVIGSVFTVTITIIGTLACYRINAKGDNQKFIERYVCLSVPIGNSLGLFLLFIFLLLYILVSNSNTRLTKDLYDVFMVLSIIIFYSIFYFRMYKSIKLISISLYTKEETDNSDL